jgi:hypothetical protein
MLVRDLPIRLKKTKFRALAFQKLGSFIRFSLGETHTQATKVTDQVF